MSGDCILILIFGSLGMVLLLWLTFGSEIKAYLQKECKYCGSDNIRKYSSISGAGVYCSDCGKDTFHKDLDGHLNDYLEKNYYYPDEHYKTKTPKEAQDE